MPRSLRSAAMALAIAALAAAPLLAQKGEKVPERPELAADADTNDAYAYYDYGLDRLRRQPERAADAFYWASRLSPTWADPYYARRVALHLSDKRQLVRYYNSASVAASPRVRAIDSLYNEAMLRNPFFFPRLDRAMLEEVIDFASDGQSYLSNGRSGDLAWDAWMSFTEGKMEEAARLYAVALKKRPKEYQHHSGRANAFYLMQQYDSAAHELTLLLGEMRAKDDKKLVYFYDSKAMYQYKLGRTYLQQNRYAEAREALGQALVEDLSFYMAHVDLAEAAFAQRDTATGLSELAMAAELRGTDPGVRFLYGQALARAARHDEAVAQFRLAAENEPYFALPYFYMAASLEAMGKRDEAAAQYRTYLARAPLKLGETAQAKQRLAALGDAGGAQP